MVAAACPTAQRLGLHAGMVAAQAQAMVPGLHVWDATPEEDDAALRELARWAIGYSPVVAPDPPDGVWIDIAGCAHLFGSEEALLAHLLGRLDNQGVTARAAVADAPGAAWAVARFRGGGVIPVGRSVEAVATLPVAALRIPPQSISIMQRLGVERVGQLAAMPRAHGAPLRQGRGAQLMAIVSDLLGVDPPLYLALRDVIVVSPPAIPLDPGGIGMSAQSRGSGGCQGIQGHPQRLGHAGETVQGTDRSEHMRGVGALAASGPHQLLFPAQDQQRASKCSSAPPRTTRLRNSLRTEASTPGSVSSSPSRYFQSMRLRTASAPRRSERFSAN
jgi:hypothetical protein